MLTSRWTHSGENWHEGQKEGEKAGSPPPGPRTVPWIREGGRERMKGSFHGSLYLLDDYSFAFKPLRNTTSESGPSKSPPVRWSSRGKWKRFRCSFSLQASLTSALLPIPCYLELQSHWNFEKGVKYYSLESQATGRNVPLRIPGCGGCCARERTFS